MDEIKKNIDESWKKAPDFTFFITTLALQASIFLGQIPNPNTDKKEENLEQAKFLIDILGMLKEKTQGNLKKEEADLLDNLLYELRMQYMSKIQGGKQ